MKNFVRNGSALVVIAPQDVVSGEVVIVNDLYGIAAISAKSGEEVTISTEGVYELNKDNQAVEQGQKAYYRADTKQVTKDAKHTVTDDNGTPENTSDDSAEDINHTLIGIFVIGSAATDKKAQVKID